MTKHSSLTPVHNTYTDDTSLSSYLFDLPEEQIAQSPAVVRGSSRLLVMDRVGNIEQPVAHEGLFADILEQLPPRCLLVANNSKVVPARLYGKRQSGGKVEFLLLTPLPLLEPSSCPAPATAGPFSNAADGSPWQTATAQGLLRSSKQVKQGETIFFTAGLQLTLQERQDFGQCTVRLFWQGDIGTLLAQHGVLPLPPYIKRAHGQDEQHPETEGAPDSSGKGTWGHDAERYQTTYSRKDKAGSVAAPTAGLHFTPELRKALEDSGREWAEATLYVGYGTFSPVRTEDIREHAMHAEYIELPQATADAICRAKAEGRPVIAVGTTSVRILEGAYNAQHESSNETNILDEHTGWINLFLYPGQPFHVIDGLITNFHLPGSSLLMLVAAFAGRERVLAAYKHAVHAGFRFFSYGDAMLIR